MQQSWKGFASYSTIGMELAGSILLGLFAGRWLDKHYHTGSTFALLGMGLGLVAAGRVVWKALRRANEEVAKLDEAERKARKEFDERKD